MKLVNLFSKKEGATLVPSETVKRRIGDEGREQKIVDAYEVGRTKDSGRTLLKFCR